MARIFEGLLHVHYGQAYIESAESEGAELEDCFRGQINGLCGATFPGTLFLITGLHTGYVHFTLDVLDVPPEIEGVWEEIVEVSFTPVSEQTILCEWGGAAVFTFPLLQAPYRVRYCARDMDRGHELDTLVDNDPVDSYALMFWLAEVAPDEIVKQTSQSADYWHRWAQTLKRQG